MSSVTYPRLGEYRKPKPRSGRKCAVCGAAPAGVQWIEVNYFRGDDISVCACDACRRTKTAAELLAAGGAK